MTLEHIRTVRSALLNALFAADPKDPIAGTEGGVRRTREPYVPQGVRPWACS